MANVNLGWPVWIGVVAEDLETQRRFYREVLGLREVDAGDDWVEFEMGGGKFELVRKSDAPQYNEGRYQVGFAVADIRDAVEELGARGVEQLTAIEGGPDSGQYWCYFRDPEGNVFEVAQKL